ncbi:hypothetical protein GJ496_009307 [Pomphorhynchus laevis]|nr:hypothetical protein GJ496_009307 [Pomphorhynchus laevis]
MRETNGNNAFISFGDDDHSLNICTDDSSNTVPSEYDVTFQILRVSDSKINTIESSSSISTYVNRSQQDNTANCVPTAVIITSATLKTPMENVLPPQSLSSNVAASSNVSTLESDRLSRIVEDDRVASNVDKKTAYPHSSVITSNTCDHCGTLGNVTTDYSQVSLLNELTADLSKWIDHILVDGGNVTTMQIRISH